MEQNTQPHQHTVPNLKNALNCFKWIGRVVGRGEHTCTLCDVMCSNIQNHIALGFILCNFLFSN